MWDLPRPGIELESPVLQADSLPMGHQGSLLILSPRTPPPTFFFLGILLFASQYPFASFFFSPSIKKKKSAHAHASM